MQLLSFRKPYEMLPPVPEEQMLTHGFAYWLYRKFKKNSWL